MEKELREKLNSIGAEHIPYWENTEPDLNENIVEAMQAAYNLAKQEDAETIRAQQQLLESMGETNKQLAKRLGAINDVVANQTGIGIPIMDAINKILNPITDGL